MDKMTIYTYSLLATVMILFGYATFSVVRTAARGKRSLLGGSPIFRFVVCGVLILAAGYLLFDNVNAVRKGEIYVVLSGRGTSHNIGYTIHRADNPSGFWEAICIYTYIALVFLCLSAAEIVWTLKRSRKVR